MITACSTVMAINIRVKISNYFPLTLQEFAFYVSLFAYILKEEQQDQTIVF